MGPQSSLGSFLAGAAGRKLLLAGRLVLGGILIYAAYSKLHFAGAWHLGDYQFLFAIAIDSYKMLPLWAVNMMAQVLPWVEIALGVLLIAGAALRWIGSATIALLLVFMVALTRAAWLHLEICGCYGNNSVSPRAELLNDAGLLILALLITGGAFLTHRARRSAA